jgi:hypothetical protein
MDADVKSVTFYLLFLTYRNKINRFNTNKLYDKT